MATTRSRSRGWTSDVVHGDGGQAAELRPVRAAVEAREERELGARVEHVRVSRVLAHDLDRAGRPAGRRRSTARCGRGRRCGRRAARSCRRGGRPRRGTPPSRRAWPASMRLIHCPFAAAGRLRGQVASRSPPSSSVTHSLPSSVPAQSSPAFTRRLGQRVDDAVVLGAAADRPVRLRGSCVERSGLITCHRSPRSVSRKTRLPARYSAPFSCAAADQRRVPVEAERRAGPPAGAGRSSLTAPLLRSHAVQVALLRLGVDDVGVRRDRTRSRTRRRRRC